MYLWKVHKLNNTFKVIGVLLSLIIFWLFYISLQTFYNSPDNKNHSYIPSNSNIVVAFKGDVMIKSVISDFIASQDEALLDKLNSSKDEVKESTGINFLSDIILFTLTQDEELISGLIFNLIDKDNFNSNFEGKIITSNESVGFLLFNENNRLSKEKLNSIAQKLIDQPTNLYSKKLAPKEKGNSYISIWSKADESWKYTSLKVIKNEIIVEGEFVIENKNHDYLTQLNQNSNSFSFSTTFIPQKVSDTTLSFLGIQDNQILGLSTNYRSIKIEQEKSFELVPDADFIYQFKNEINASEVLKNIASRETISNINASNFEFGGQLFNYKQVDPKTVYIGRTEFGKTSTRSDNSLLKIKGKPSYLNQIEGNSFILRLISIFPAYRVGNSLSNTIQNIDFEVNPISNNIIKINGKIEFKKESYATIELIKNLLEFRQ